MKTSQTKKVLEYLQTHKKGITSWDAFERFHATRLSAIIFNLRHQGYNITSELETKKNKDGGCTTFSRYKLEG